MNGTQADLPPGPRLVPSVAGTALSWLRAHCVDGGNKAWRRTVSSLRFEPGFEPLSF